MRPSFRWILALLALAAPALAGEEPPLPDSRLGHRTAPLLLLSRPEVRADMGMTPAQAESAARAIRSFYVQAYALRGKPSTPETIRARRAVDDEAFAWIDSQLSPEQQARLSQIDLQWEGPRALVSRPSIARMLDLSKDQVHTLTTAVARRDAAHAKGHADADRILGEVALACLNDAQRETWKGLLGKPFSPQVAPR
jgi:hypothetical protein